MSAALLLACGSSSSGGTHPPNDSGACAPTGSTIAGSVGGTAFGSVASALWIGNPGAPDQATTRVFYVFDKPVQCADIAAAGWDGRITSGTQVLEMKVWGTTPQSYTVTTSMTPAPGEAATPYTVAGAGAMDQQASSGSVTVSALDANNSASGCFAIAYPQGNLTGTFQAAWCANGVEP